LSYVFEVNDPMTYLAELELGHWLIIGGCIAVIAGRDGAASLSFKAKAIEVHASGCT
jgi:hypothetical protein